MTREGLKSQTTLAVDDINLADPDFWLREDGHRALAMLRESRPISWHEHEAAGQGFWALVDTEDIAEVNRDFQTFVNKYGDRLDYDPGKGVRPGTGALTELDPPEHTRNRRAINKGFTPRQVRNLENYVRDQAQSLVRQFEDDAEIDFVDELATRLPIEIICDLVGVGEADREYLLELTNTARTGLLDRGNTPEEVAAAVTALREYGVRLAAEKMADPQDDLLSEIAQMKVDDQPLSKEEIGGYFGQLISAGSGTTRSAIAYGMLAFTHYPEQRRLFIDDPARLGISMADEVIRWATPIRSVMRVLERDIEFKKVRMLAGQKVTMWFMAANRDPEVYPNPFSFDITREPNPHQSFGAGGPHRCLGANLARREIYVFFDELFRRFPRSAVISDPVFERSIHLNGIREMRVRLAG